MIYQNEMTGSYTTSIGGKLFMKHSRLFSAFVSQLISKACKFKLLFFFSDHVFIPVPLVHENFEDLTDLDLYNDPSQVTGKVRPLLVFENTHAKYCQEQSMGCVCQEPQVHKVSCKAFTKSCLVWNFSLLSGQ